MRRGRVFHKTLTLAGLASVVIALAVAWRWPRTDHIYSVTEIRRAVDAAVSGGASTAPPWAGRVVDVRGSVGEMQGPLPISGGSYQAITLQPLVQEEVAQHLLSSRYQPVLIVRVTRAQYTVIAGLDAHGYERGARTPSYPDPLCPPTRLASLACGWIDSLRRDRVETPFVFHLRIDPASRRTCSRPWMMCYDADLVTIPPVIRG